VQAPPPAIRNFALTPASQHADPLDFEVPTDAKILNKATEPLVDKYDLSSGGLKGYLDGIWQRACTSRMEDVLSVPDSNGVPRSLITEYGMVTQDDCFNHTQTYVEQQTRQGQHSLMIYILAYGSLTKEARDIVSLYANQYIVLQQDGYDIGVGACLLKVIIGKAVVDSIASEATIFMAIRNLPKKMKELNSDISLFNMYVAQLKAALAARGAVSSDLVVSLFQAYSVVSDESFVRYMESKYNLFFEGVLVDPDAVIQIAITRYNICLDQKTWRAPQKKNKVVAMIAKDKGTRKPKKIENEDGSSPRKIARRERDAWKKDPPENNEKTQVRKGKTYNWCKWHEMWVIHDPKACTLQHDKKRKKKVNFQPNDDYAKPKGKPKGLKVSPALQSILHDDVEDAESSDDE
jgi:hypothetical protein